MKLLAYFIIVLSAQGCVNSNTPDCAGSERWPAQMAYGFLKNSGIITNDKIDFSKTKVVRLASEKNGKDKFYDEDLYHQIHHITFFEKNGNEISVITRSDATNIECSMGDVEVYLISKQSSNQNNKNNEGQSRVSQHPKTKVPLGRVKRGQDVKS